MQINYQALGSGAGVKQFQRRPGQLRRQRRRDDRRGDRGGQGRRRAAADDGGQHRARVQPARRRRASSSSRAKPTSGSSSARSRSGTTRRSPSANPGVTLPDTKITVVTRSDGSGTTFVFTTHLSAISDAWKSGPGAGKSVNFPVGVGGKGNPGVTALIKQTPGAIGYVEYGYAKQTQMPMATLREQERQVREGRSDEPDRPRWRASSCRPTCAPGSRIPAGATAYPIVTYTWLLCYKKYDDREDRRRAQGGHPLRPDATGRSSASSSATSRCPPNVGHRGLEGARTDLLMSRSDGRRSRASSFQSDAHAARSSGAPPDCDISRPPSTARGRRRSRVPRAAPLAVAWVTVAPRRSTSSASIARQALPAMQRYGAAFLVGTDVGRRTSAQFGILPAIVGHAVQLDPRARHRHACSASRSRSS